MMKFIYFLLACLPQTLWADPFDDAEGYVNRQGPPPWMDGVDVGMLILSYGVFALALIGLGWLLFKKPEAMHRLESVILRPFKAIFATAQRLGGVSAIMLQIIGGLAAFLTLSVWVFFCQWLKHEGFGALCMLGLAFAALMLVRLLKGGKKPQSI